MSFSLAAAVWLAGWFLMPWPQDNAMLELIHHSRPAVYHVIRWTYLAMWLTAPWIFSSLVLSAAYTFMSRHEGRGRGRRPCRFKSCSFLQNLPSNDPATQT